MTGISEENLHVRLEVVVDFVVLVSQLPVVDSIFLCLISCAVLLSFTCGLKALLYIEIKLVVVVTGWVDCLTNLGFESLWFCYLMGLEKFGKEFENVDECTYLSGLRRRLLC